MSAEAGASIGIFDEAPWQMTLGERAALEGILSQLKPRLAIEIGTAEGGSLRCIAKHSGHVHSFDLVPPDLDMSELSRVTLHTGDGHVLLPEALAELAQDGINVDFALVDGDHTSDGVERDTRDLLASSAVRTTVILFHDTMNDDVRAGLKRINVASEPKITYFDLDFVTGRLNYGGPFHHQLWGGLGLMVVDIDAGHRWQASQPTSDAYEPFELVSPVRDALVAREQAGRSTVPGSVSDVLLAGLADHRELMELRLELARAQQLSNDIRNSKSWRLTAPFRRAKRLVADAAANVGLRRRSHRSS